MSLEGRETICFNPSCNESQNYDRNSVICQFCGSTLLLKKRYRAVKVLGRGGFGQTFLAFDLAEDSPTLCVVKQFWRVLDRGDSEKFLFGDAINKLKELGNHPQIPAVIDSFAENGNFYLVQKYITGKNLAILLGEKGQFSAAEVWQILENLLPVLQFIHSHQVIHRDIKPENIIQIKSLNDLFLVDFSAAKLVTETFFVTPGTTIGSAEYAAPEQVRGSAVFSSDLYSLGVVCLNLLTGIRPFHLFDLANNCWVWRNYWLSDLASSVEYDLAQIIDRLIEPSLEKRFPSAEVALTEMQKLTGKKIPISAPPPKQTWETYATLVGDGGLFSGINAIALSPDDKMLASVSDDRTICLWDIGHFVETLRATSLQEFFTLKAHTGKVKSVAFHPHSPNILASGSSDRQIKLWDLQKRQEIHTILGHNGAVNALAFSPDGKILASGSADKTVKLWHPEIGEQITTLSGAKLGINAIAFSPVSPILASASSDQIVHIWDLIKFELICTLVGHTGGVRAIVFSPDGKLLATGGEDRTIRLWDTTTWQCNCILSGHPWLISALTFSPNNQILISGSWDKTVKLWQVSTGKEIGILVGHTDLVSCVAISSDGSFIASGSQDKTIKLYKQN
ncbi:serine/threonine protein kinase [Phormidium sp. LEGE 05292]|uniref:serine/threonine-protein kinase n=1 Tax=[Phormidium] sp. LEGE 05292 TaxID=767427 RepID=UPI0018817B37|nr:serine/threonine-protein kinase [Phormidium sp. LEGE 05292]MBE9224650.1 serine/threonine protein kinase [Phormidium sp. LEGE 05292]